MRSYEDLDARNGMNRAPRSSRDLTARSFENQLMGYCTVASLYNDSLFNEFSLQRTQAFGPVFFTILFHVIASLFNEPPYNESLRLTNEF